MHPKELIGKKAVRTAPIYEVCHGYSVMLSPTKEPNYSFTETPILILEATDAHVVYERTEPGLLSEEIDKTPKVLGSKYVDDNWTDYDELMNNALAKQIELG